MSLKNKLFQPFDSSYMLCLTRTSSNTEYYNLPRLAPCVANNFNGTLCTIVSEPYIQKIIHINGKVKEYAFINVRPVDEEDEYRVLFDEHALII